MPSRPAALFFMVLIISHRFIILKGLVRSEGSWKHSSASWGSFALLEHWSVFPWLVTRSWWATWSAVTCGLGWVFVQSFPRIRFVFQAFLFLWVICGIGFSHWLAMLTPGHGCVCVSIVRWGRKRGALHHEWVPCDLHLPSFRRVCRLHWFLYIPM